MENYFKKNKWLVFLYGVFSLVTYIFLTTIFTAFSWITDTAMEKNFARGQIVSLQVALVMIGFMFFLYLIFFLERYLLFVISKSLREAVFKKTLRMTHKGFYEKDNSYYLSMLVNDIDILESEYYSGQIDIIGEILRILVTFVFVGLIGIKYVFLIILLVLPSVLQPLILKGKISRAGLKNSQALEMYNDITNEYIYGMEEIITTNNQKLFTNKFEKEVERLEETRFKSKLIQAYDSVLSYLSVYILKLLGPMLYVNNALKGFLTVPTATALFGYTDNIAGPIIVTLDTYKRINSSRNIKRKIDDFLVDGTYLEPELQEIEKIETINITNLCFSYENNEVLKGVDYSFKAGKKYAIFGTSGSGKSTLIKLMMGLDKSYDGEIWYNHKELKEITTSSLWNQLAYIQQKVFVMTGTLRENICMFSEAYTKEEVNIAVQLAGLEELVKSLRGGLDSLLEEGGKGLSGGEKQRISIARALVANKSILLLDESFSALDNINSQMIEKEILTTDKTVLSITHRLNENLYYYDEILVLKDGRLAESGKYDDLKKSGSYFYQLTSSKEGGTR